MDEWLTIDQAAKLLGINKATVYRWSKSGELPIYKIVHKSRIKKSDIDKLLNDIQLLHKKPTKTKQNKK